MRRPVRTALVVAAAALVGCVGGAAQEAARTDLSQGVGKSTPGAQLFLRAYEVFSHPRCSNCHPRDDRPRWGATMRIHGMNVQRGRERPLGGEHVA